MFQDKHSVALSTGRDEFMDQFARCKSVLSLWWVFVLLLVFLSFKTTTAFTSSRPKRLFSHSCSTYFERKDNHKTNCKPLHATPTVSTSNGSKKKRGGNVIEECLETVRNQQRQGEERQESSSNVILFLDFNNIRGKSDFALSHANMLAEIFSWKENQTFDNDDLLVICAIDHASQASSHFISKNILAVFAGPDQTADDVIAHGTKWFVGHRLDEGQQQQQQLENPNSDLDGERAVSDSDMVFVVTSDGELRMRCLRANNNNNRNKRKKKTQKDRVKVFGSPHFLDSLERHSRPKQQQSQHQQHTLDLLQEELFMVENDLRLYESKRPPWSSRQDRIAALESGPWKSTLLFPPDENVPHQLFTSDENQKTTAFHEKTWHRILIAETLRRLMIPRQQHESPNKLLSRYQEYYIEQHLDTDDHGTFNNMTGILLWDDHRIRQDRDAQHYLRLYLEESFQTANKNVAGADGDEEGSSTDVTISTQKASNKLNPSDQPIEMFPAVSTPLDDAVDLLRRFASETPTKTQDQILMRYQREAPSHLQFSRREDLRQLLLLIAVRERRGSDNKQKWYLLPLSHSSSSTSDTTAATSSSSFHLDFYVQPGRGRRLAKRRKKALEYVKSSSLQIRDESLTAKLKALQETWFHEVLSKETLPHKTSGGGKID